MADSNAVRSRRNRDSRRKNARVPKALDEDGATALMRAVGALPRPTPGEDVEWPDVCVALSHFFSKAEVQIVDTRVGQRGQGMISYLKIFLPERRK